MNLESLHQRNFEPINRKVTPGPSLQKEIERRLKHKAKLNEVIELFNRKPKKGHFGLLNVSPIYHCNKEVALKNLVKFYYSNDKISQKKLGLNFNKSSLNIYKNNSINLNITFFEISSSLFANLYNF